MTNPWDALRQIHEELWDPAVCLDLLAPGVVPGIDISAFHLHSIRESALGAFLDLTDGRSARAISTLESLLLHQYQELEVPWQGTFKVTAEQADPPAAGAEMWLHYDPNWRQFLGCILSVTLAFFEDELPERLRRAITDAIERCVEGEPLDRIPEWYTNPNLMHAWLEAWFGFRSGQEDLVKAGAARAELIVRRFDEFGDIDEYNSPTYDGIDLFAILLWVVLPPTPQFAHQGARLLDHLLTRMRLLFHPTLENSCGPYVRAYGLEMSHYVSLSGLWMSILGFGDGLLPSPLESGTDHIHDLYFLPVFQHLKDVIHLELEPFPVAKSRIHRQAFGPIVASSLLTANLNLGCESGRVAEFARDQYFPLVIHLASGGERLFAGLQLGDKVARVDAELRSDESAHVSVLATDSPFTLALRSSHPLERSGNTLHLHSLSMSFSESFDLVSQRSELDREWTSTISVARLSVEIEIGVP